MNDPRLLRGAPLRNQIIEQVKADLAAPAPHWQARIHCHRRCGRGGRLYPQSEAFG